MNHFIQFSQSQTTTTCALQSPALKEKPAESCPFDRLVRLCRAFSFGKLLQVIAIGKPRVAQSRPTMVCLESARLSPVN